MVSSQEIMAEIGNKIGSSISRRVQKRRQVGRTPISAMLF